MKKNELNKQHIANMLREYCERYESQNKASEALKISSSTVSRILASKWDLITDDMWRNIAGQVGANKVGWQVVETKNFLELNTTYKDAKSNSLVMAIVGAAGSGKTFTARHFANENSNVYLLCCNEYWNRKQFLSELLTVMGRSYHGYTVAEMMSEVVIRLRKIQEPLLILDEADKLSDPVLNFFITLFNQLEDECGIILQATNYLEKRLRSGVELNRKGYNETWSRVKRRCIPLHGVCADDIAGICIANGIPDMKTIDLIIEDSESDIRRVKHRIHAVKKMNGKKKK